MDNLTAPLSSEHSGAPDHDVKSPENHLHPQEGSPSSDPTTPKAPSTSTGWFGWLRSGPKIKTAAAASYPSESLDTPPGDGKEPEPPPEPQSKTEPAQTPVNAEVASEDQEQVASGTKDTEPLQPSQRLSWQRLWAKSELRPTNVEGSTASTTDQPSSIPATGDTTPAEDVQTDQKGLAKSSAWAFWSKIPESSRSNTTSTTGDMGKLAVAGANSQSNPEDAIVGPKGIPKATGLSSKLRALQSLQKNASQNVPDSDVGTRPSSVATPDSSQDVVESKGKQQEGNLLLPSFYQTFSHVSETNSLWQRFGRLFYAGSPATRHVNVIRDPPRIKKALAIGVHGYFPLPIIQTVFGRPTGTSIKFAESAAKAIDEYVQARGYSVQSIEKIALEGEGKIADRVDLLWKLLLNWVETIREADFILLACHSQGVPVAISLVSKLIGCGYVTASRSGVCAMAGVNLGPFADYKSRWIGGSAGELFDFAQPESQVSRNYRMALETALHSGVKIVYVGSMDDQVSLFVATTC